MLFEGGAPAGLSALGSLQGVRKAPEVSGEPEPIELFGSLATAAHGRLCCCALAWLGLGG